MDRSVYIVIRRTGEDGSPAVSDPLLSNEAAAKHARRVSTLGVLFKNIRLFIYLAVSGLSGTLGTCHCRAWTLLFQRVGQAALACGMLVPHQGLNPSPPHRKTDS